MYTAIVIISVIVIGFIVLKLTEKQIDRMIDQAFDGFENYDNLNG